MPRLSKKSVSQRRKEDKERKERRRQRLSETGSPVSDESVAVQQGVIEISDGGLAHPFPSSVSDEGPSVSLTMGVLEISDGGPSQPTKKPSVSRELHSDLYSELHSDLHSELPSQLSSDIASQLLDAFSENSFEHFLGNFTDSSSSNIENNSDTCIVSRIKPCVQRTNNIQIHSGALHSKPLYTATPVFNKSTLRPVGSDIFILGSFHQADKMFSQESRGSQCTLNSLCALIFATYSHINTRKDLDKVLLHGDLLYKKTIFDLKTGGKLKSKLLDFEELPNVVNVFNKKISIIKSDVISGVCTQQLSTSYLPSLYQSLHSAYLKCPSFLIMTGSVCSALFMKDDQYFFFDSHSHGVDGLSSEDGTSVLVSFNRLEDLVTYMYAVYCSMGIDLTDQYDLLPVHFMNSPCEGNEITDKNVSMIDTKYDANDIVIEDKKRTTAQTSESNEWKTVIHKRNKQSDIHKKDESEGRNSPDNARNDCHTTLIGKYFKDQLQRNEKNKMNDKKVTDRKDYFRLYKQKQRQCAKFKIKDRECTVKSKRKARESEEFRKKDRECTLEAKRRARESEEFKKTEKEYSLKSKRTARESEEFREKDRECTLKAMRHARESEEYRKREKEYSLKSKRTARESEEFKKTEKEYSLTSKRTARKSEEFKKTEEEYSLKSKRTARKSEEFKKTEKQYSLKSKRTARKSEEFKKTEKEYSLKSKRTARESEEFREQDRECTLKAMRHARESEEYRKREKEYSLKSKRTERESEEFKKTEKEYSLKSKKTARESGEFRKKEKEYSKASKRRARLVAEYRDWEAEKKQECRKCHEFKQNEIDVQRKSKRKARLNSYNLEKERISKQQWRFDERNKKAENIIDCKRKASKRRNPFFSQAESLSAKHRKYGCDMDACIENFHKRIAVGPTYICTCCHQTWFRQSVCEAKPLHFGQNEKYLTGVLSVDNKEWICNTCKTSIMSGKVPKLSVFGKRSEAELPKVLR